jgi:hypothetical protein
MLDTIPSDVVPHPVTTHCFPKKSLVGNDVTQIGMTSVFSSTRGESFKMAMSLRRYDALKFSWITIWLTV